MFPASHAGNTGSNPVRATSKEGIREFYRIPFFSFGEKRGDAHRTLNP